MSFSEFTNNKNKGVLWGLLQEGGVFNNIPASMFQNVKHIFEMSIVSMKPDFDLFFENNDEGDNDYDKKAADMIINSNKSVIKKVIDEVNKIKMQNENSMKQAQAAQAAHAAHAAQMRGNQPQSNNLKPVALALSPTPMPTKKPKIEEIYRADDIKKTRMSELEIRLKEKQAEMDIMLNNKKPEHIDFSDKALGINKESDLYDKKLAGDEMERLLAEALASRERELEKLNIDSNSYNKNTNSGNGGNGGNGGNNDGTDIPVNKIVMKRPRESKNVTFNDADNTKVEYETHDSEHHKIEDIHNQNDDDNTLSFFSKLKTKKSDTNVKPGYSSITLDDIMNSINDDENDNDNHNDNHNNNHNEGIRLKIQDMTNINGNSSRVWGEMREARDIQDIQEIQEIQEIRELREMQRYVILEQKIQGIQNDMNAIKKNQELILSLLEKKLH